MTGVILGVVLLVLLIALVVLQGAIEWFNFDPDKLIPGKKKEKEDPAALPDKNAPAVKLSSKKTVSKKPAAKKPAAKKPAVKKAVPKKGKGK